MLKKFAIGIALAILAAFAGVSYARPTIVTTCIDQTTGSAKVGFLWPVNTNCIPIGFYLQFFPGGNQGSPDVSAALAAATATPRRVIIEGGGAFAITQNITIPSGSVLDVRPGSCLAPSSGKTLLVHGTFEKNVFTQIFCGAGTVTGMTFARPEWWGVTGTADNVPIQKAIAAVEGSFGSDGDKRQVGLACRQYNLAATITLSPTNWINHRFRGCAEGNGGSALYAAPGFSGAYLFNVAGQRYGLPGVIADYEIGDLQLVNNSGNALLGCISVSIVAGYQLEGDKENLLENVACQNFKYGFAAGALRLLRVDRFSFSSNVLNAICYQLIPNDANSFVGDLNFVNQNCSPRSAPPELVDSTDIRGTAYGFLGTPNGGGVAGVSFSGTFYKSNFGFRLQASNGGGVSDIFFGQGGKTQIDGFQCNVFDIQANGLGTTAGQRTLVSNVIASDLYIRGVQPGCTMINILLTATGGAGNVTMDSFQLNNSFLANIGGYGVIADGPITNSGLSGNRWLGDGHSGTSGVLLKNGVNTFSMSGETCQGGINSLVTVSNASPAVVTWWGGAHGLAADSPVRFTTTGALPTGLSVGTTYYVLASGLTSNTFRVSVTPGGAAVNTSSAGSGFQNAAAANTTFLYDQWIHVDTSTSNISIQPTNVTNGLCGNPILNDSVNGATNSIGTIH
jgi:hypothetical protein